MVIAYLDEIGLAELSPHLPLKVYPYIYCLLSLGELVSTLANCKNGSARDLRM